MKTDKELAADILVAMIQAKMINVAAPATTKKLADETAATYRTVYAAIHNPSAG